MKKALYTIFPILIAFAVAGGLLVCLENYAPHSEIGLFAKGIAIVGCIAIAVVLARNSAKSKFPMISGILSLLICVGVYLVSVQIPFCPECDGISAEQLGLLSHWIKSDF